jgi:hypothetical protein
MYYYYDFMFMPLRCWDGNTRNDHVYELIIHTNGVRRLIPLPELNRL